MVSREASRLSRTDKDWCRLVEVCQIFGTLIGDDQQVERAQYEADLARQRFMSVDPHHRLVADGLEADWNAKLRALQEAQECCDREYAADCAPLTQEQRARVLALAVDFPRLWRDPQTPPRERKRLIRFLIEDVTVTRADTITAQVRFRGGSTRTLTLPVPLRVWERTKTSPDVMAEVDTLLDAHTPGRIERARASLREREPVYPADGRGSRQGSRGAHESL